MVDIEIKKNIHSETIWRNLRRGFTVVGAVVVVVGVDSIHHW